MGAHLSVCVCLFTTKGIKQTRRCHNLKKAWQIKAGIPSREFIARSRAQYLLCFPAVYLWTAVVPMLQCTSVAAFISRFFRFINNLMADRPRAQFSESDESDTETAPLLTNAKRDVEYGAIADESAGHSVERAPARPSVTPLPLKQVAVLAFVRTATPMAFNQVSPYINEMITDIGVTTDPREVGYYSGIVQSTFALVQALTVLKTGMLADQFGRKPIVLISLLGITVSTLIFGISKTLWLAIVSRALAGFVGGNAMLINSAVGDITDETNQAQAYAFVGLAFNAASVIAPLYGGLFAKPEREFPDSFGRIAFLREYPYFLPCAVSALWVFMGFITCMTYMEETKIHRPILKKTAACYSTQDVSEICTPKRESALKIALDPVLFSVLKMFFMLNALNGAASAVFTLFAFTPVKDGGLSRNPAEIGNIIASSGLIVALLEVLVISKLQRHFGTLKLLRFSMALWPICFTMFPLINALASATMGVGSEHVNLGTQVAGKASTTEPASVVVWLAVLLLLVIQRLATMAYPLSLMLTRNAAPSNEVLGTVFGLSQLVGCISRAIAPAFISSLFAFSKEHSVWGGNFVWAVMIGLSLLGVRQSFTVRDGSAERNATLKSQSIN